MDAVQNVAPVLGTQDILPTANGDYIGVLTFLSFAFSVLAAVLAIDMYALLRTGQFGRTWRVLIIATVMFALMHALRLAELLNFDSFRGAHLSEIVELMFVISLTYAFYLQRQAFGHSKRSTTAPEDENSPEDNEEVSTSHEWARLNGHYETPPLAPTQSEVHEGTTNRL